MQLLNNYYFLCLLFCDYNVRIFCGDCHTSLGRIFKTFSWYITSLQIPRSLVGKPNK